MSFLFKKPDPAEQAREWKKQLRGEIRQLEREIRGIEREEAKVKIQIKAAAKRGDTNSAKIMARELIQSRKAKERLYAARAQLNSVAMQLQNQLATIRMAGAMQSSAQVMKSMNSLVKLPQLHRTMMVMAREMEKAGLIEEMISDTLEMDDEEIADAADEEVEKVFLEITTGVMEKATKTSQTLPEETEEETEANKEEEDLLAQRLGALKG